MSFSSFERGRALSRLADEHFELLVIGGGITGAGIALDAASRGMRTALVDKGDFASGTSSKSSKLVHGGLRYLQHGDVGLVYESLSERRRLLVNAPHLVRVMPFLIPLFGRQGTTNRGAAKAMGTALWLYDLTGGARIGKLHRRISRDEAALHMPTLRADRLLAGWLYYDAQADDARLTLAVLRTAVLDHGAVALNHCGVVGVSKGIDGKIDGAVLENGIEVRADTVVNATGVWADEVRALDESTLPRTLRPAKGVHLTVPWTKLRNDIAAVLPARDRRSVFVVPWGEHVYLGTTDTDYRGSLDRPRCTPEDVSYLLDAVSAVLREPLCPGDVRGTWAGLRPLVAGAPDAQTADLSRRHALHVSESGMVTITGGKLTTYRRMAADTVDLVASRGGRHVGRSRTGWLALRGARGHAAIRDEHLRSRHGGEARVLSAMIENDRSLGAPLVDGLPYLRAEAVYAVRYEMATTLDDVLSRRTRARLLDARASAAAAEDVTGLIGPELGWDDNECRAQVDAYRSDVDGEWAAAGLTATESMIRADH